MEELLIKLRSYSRFLELEDNIPYWESRKPELQVRISEMDWNLQQKEQELLDMKNPGFIQKFFGRTEAKQEKLSSQILKITAARTAAQWELESLNKKITAGTQELEELTGSREAYEAAKKDMCLTPAQEGRLMMEEISAFAPAAMETAGRMLKELEDARDWMQTNQTGQNNRKMEYLRNGEAAAIRLAGILSVLPEGVAAVGPYLRDPKGFIYGATSELKQLDRLNSAIEQIQTINNQLHLLLGE